MRRLQPIATATFAAAALPTRHGTAAAAQHPFTAVTAVTALSTPLAALTTTTVPASSRFPRGKKASEGGGSEGGGAKTWLKSRP